MAGVNESFVEIFFEVLEEIFVKKIATLAAVASVAAVMFVPGQASADSAELRIAGTITPSPCTPVFTGGGVVDYGKIPASSLNPTAQTTLAEKTIQLSITCGAPLRFGFKVIDERAASAVTSLETIPGATPNMKFGLGTSDGKKIGAYSLQVTGQTANGGGYAAVLVSRTSGHDWNFLVNQEGLSSAEGRLISFSSTPINWPSANESVTADIRVTTAIDQGSNLPLTHAIPLDGLSTFELIYL
ncbi:DUF1120 domain-containing protein [Variovorax sp. KBS0712]|uniref:DUF1120 domain-containing protein n=1 Tax=Variovorax sp. KBS0712 TaxID=2578111 RepID=UPI00111A3073|nr:DUF1120 domain-containing protein [Variovorax sp. KBS0712]TSD60058.1 DUF1120 domain-containing protein [Variovorax sp. KBS0712]